MGPLKKKSSSPSSLKTKSDIIFYFLGCSGADHMCTCCSRKATGLGDQGSGPALILTGYLTVG